MAFLNRFSDSLGGTWQNPTVQPTPQYIYQQEMASVQPRRRPNRISKPNSAGNSPHGAQMLNRRRTTAGQWHSRHTSRLSQGLENYINAQSSRPISWHPSSQHGFQASTMPVYDDANVQSECNTGATYTTAEINGLVTPLTYPYPDEFLYQGEAFPFLDEGLNYPGSVDPEVFPSYANSVQTSASFSSDPYHFHPYSTTYPKTADGIEYVTSPPPRNQATAPPTPDFLPIQNFTKSPSPERSQPEPAVFREGHDRKSLFASSSTVAGNDLVGVGLYDLPSPTDRPKCLQLEQTFVPEEPSEEAEEADGTGDTEDDDSDAEKDSQHDNDSKDEEQAHFSQERPSNLLNHTFFFETEGDEQGVRTAWGQSDPHAHQLHNAQNPSFWSVPNHAPAPYGWI